MIKCWDIDRATEVFTEAFMEASETPVFNLRQGVIYKAIKEIRDHADPEDLDAIMEIIDEAITEYPEIQAAAAGYKNAFNPDFNFENWESRMSEVDGEETDESKLNMRARVKSDFLRKKFKDPSSKTTAGRAMLYFQRDTKQLLMQVFMVDREHGYLVSDQDLLQNIRNYKQKLLDTVVEYLKTQGYSDRLLGSTQLYDESGTFLDILSAESPLRKAIEAKLEIGRSFGTLRLKEAYENFHAEKGNWREDKKFLEAYNAKLLLDDFDAITTMLLGQIVKPGSRQYNRLSNDSYETRISRATNMWNNGYGDDVENIADLVSDVTLMLILSSRKYSWKGGPMKDLYLSFQDFNYILTKVKKLSQDPTSKKIVLDDAFFNQNANRDANISDETKRTLATLRKLKQQLGYANPSPTFEDVLAFISDNPLRHLHAIFDLLCNTNALNYYSGINANDKNLIWTVGKELFGTWINEVDEEGNSIPSRSLYDLHRNSHNDRIFEIVTLIADSMFADLFLQYYEDLEGTLKVRLLQDYAVSQEKNQILYSMRLTHGMLDPERFKRFLSKYVGEKGIKYRQETQVYPGKEYAKSWLVENPNYDETIPGSKPKIALKAQFLKGVEIPIGNLMKIQYQDGKMIDLNPKNRNVFTKDMESVWKSDEFRDFIKDSIGIDFNTDVELASAYEEGFKYTDSRGQSQINYLNLVKDIANLCGAVVYNQTFNNVIVPNILQNSGRERNKRNVELLRDIQYTGQSVPKINPETGVVEMIADANKEAYLDKLGLAYATVHGLLTSAQVKTGEGTALAAECLSCLRSSHAYQILTLNRNKKSASKHMTYVNNENGFFKGQAKRREFKSDATVKVNTSMSSAESFTASFLGGFVGAFVQSDDTSTINRNGNAFIVPAVYSDKTALEELAIQLKAYSRNLPDKRFIDMSDSELELEMKYEFGDLYDNIVKNINSENLHFAQILGINTDAILYGVHPIEVYRESLTQISLELCSNTDLLNIAESKFRDEKLGIEIRRLRAENKSSDEIVEILKLDKKFKKTLGGLRKDRTISQMHDMMTEYNKTHRRKPIEMCEHVHYLYDKDGMLVPNDTLIALWGRFKGDQQINDQLGITDLYPEGHKEASTAEGYFKYEKDLRMALELLTDGVEIFLLGNLSKLKQEELRYLRETYPDWITPSYKMAIAKVFKPTTKYNVGDVISENGNITEIMQVGNLSGNTSYFCRIKTTDGRDLTLWFNEDTLNAVINQGASYSPIPVSQRQGIWEVTEDPNLIKLYAASPETRDMIRVHPMLSKLNRISYLSALQYTCSVGGAHYVYKGGGANVLEEEASRWLASNKRNVCYASTVHKYQNKTLNGVPKLYQIAPIEDIKSIIYSIMGDIDSHKPIDGGMFVNPWFPILENNSLGGEAAGLDKKQFGTYYYEKYAAGGIIKTAGFAITNQRQRRSKPYRNLCKNITDRTWIKEFASKDGTDISEYLDITRDYNGNIINWVLDDNGLGTFYLRETDDGEGCGRFKLAKIEAIYTNGIEERSFEGSVPLGWRPTNRYKIYEFPVTAKGEIDTSHPDIQAQLNDPNISDIAPILKLDGADENGEFLIDSNWKMYNLVFGGAWALSFDYTGTLLPSENSIFQMVHALNNIGYKRTIDNNDENFGEERYDTEFIDNVQDLDDLWLPLKYSDISYAPNIGALKSTLMNVNPKEGLYQDTYLNAMNIMMAQLGIQLDKEHHADESEVSMPTQIIQACANKGYTIHYSDKLYKSLSTLTEIAISDCMDGIMEIMPGHENKGKLLTEVANIIVDKLIHSLDDNAALEAAMSHLIEKAKGGHKLEASDVVGLVAWSDAKLYNKIYNDLASHLTNNAIKMKFPGTLAVICPTERVELMYGDRRLDSYADPDNNLSEEIALLIHQDAIRNGEYPKLLIFDEDVNYGASVLDRLNMASNIDTLHHYWIEWNYADGTPVVDENGEPFRESITIDMPSQYFKVKDWLGYGAGSGEIVIDGKTISRKGMMVSRVYENITEGRELGAYNARFSSLEKSDTGKSLRFCIFDLDSVKAMFDFNDIDVTYENALDLLEEEKYIEPQKEKAIDLILRLMAKKYPKSYKLIEDYTKSHQLIDITEVVRLLNDPKTNSLEKDFTEATFKICKVLTYKEMEKDLFKISKDYEGERKLYVNDEIITVNPDTIETLAYELIMPKVYQSRFGLEEYDQVLTILADKDFFIKRAINKLKELHVSDNCFHYELKNFNGKHVYIYDSRLGEPDPAIFVPKTFYPFELENGKWERHDIDGNYMHGLASENDKIMLVGNLGYEVIVTDNPGYYLENMKYNIATFSNTTVNEDALQELVTSLKDTKSKNAQKFIRSIANKKGVIRRIANLRKRNDAINNLSLEPSENEIPEVTNLINLFIKEGHELHASFSKSLDIIAGRIPAQSQQSFMPQRVVAFDNNNINTAYVSTFQLFLQGSDLDIDAVTLLGSEFDENGKYVIWSPLADISSIDNLEASLLLPFPTGHTTDILVNNSKDSFFTIYDDYIYDLFELDTEIDTDENGLLTSTISKGEDGFNILKLKDATPERLKLLAQFLEDVEQHGLFIKGELKSDDSWKPSEELIKEWENVIQLDEEHYLERPNALKDLGFTTPEAAYSALKQIKELIDRHNMYIHSSDLRTRERMTKNQCQWAMYLICSTPSNLVELMVGVDVSTAPIKDKETGAVAQSPYNGDDKLAAPGNYNTIHRSFQEGQIGKQCVGIGAVSIKVNSTTQYYMDAVLRSGSEELRERLLLPRVNKWGERTSKGERGYFIGGKLRKGLSNLYDKNTEKGVFQKNQEILELLDSILTEDDITPNVAMSLAAMLSVAVDNAKDLALAKINAGPKMFGFYAYGISLGMDIRDLAKIINTPQGRAISKFCEGNVLNGQMGAFSALQAIRKLEGKDLFHDLILFDVVGIENVSEGGNTRERASGVVIDNNQKKTASEVVLALIKGYYSKYIENNPEAINKLKLKPNVRNKKGQIDFNTNLDKMIYQISILGKMEDCINFITNETLNPIWGLVKKQIPELENAVEWEASIHQLLEFCSKYGNLVSTYYSHKDDDHYYARDLKILAQGAEEMRVLGSILSSNKGVKSRTELGTTFIKTIENAVIDRKELMGLSPSEDDRIDFVLFCTDKLYREDAIRKYELVKHSVNILDVISTAPHFLSYLRTCCIPYAAFKVGSAKFRARDKYYDPVIQELKLTKSSDKENAIKGIESAVNFRMLKEWLAQEQMHFFLPAGSKMFVGRNQDTVITKSDLYIPLFDKDGNGLATFKYYMDEVIIPQLRQNSSYKHNAFVHGLTPFELTKTGTHAAVTAHTLDGNMMPFTESQIVLMQTYQADFSSMYDFDFPGGKTPLFNTIPNYADAFYLYSLYVFGGKKSQRSLMALFDDGECDLAKRFETFEAQVDLESNFDFDLMDLVKWCAPNGNQYHPASDYFYAPSPNLFGRELLLKLSTKKGKGSADELVDAEDNGKANKKMEQVEATSTPIAKQNYLNPTTNELMLGENSYSMGVNTRITKQPDLNNIVLDEANPEESFALVPNTVSGTYSVVANGILSPRSQEILNFIDSNLDSAYIYVYDADEGAYSLGIDTDALHALVIEATNEIDENC